MICAHLCETLSCNICEKSAWPRKNILKKSLLKNKFGTVMASEYAFLYNLMSFILLS